MQYNQLTDQELLLKLNKAIKECKLLQMYLMDVNDDYGKIKLAKLKYEFTKHEYLTLLKEAKIRKLQIDEQNRMTKILFS